VIDKPAGLVVHPAPGHWSGTLMNGLLAHHAAAFELPRAGLVHRLDKDTSGLMIAAKNLVTMTALVRALAARELRREYLAIAHGGPSAAPGRPKPLSAPGDTKWPLQGPGGSQRSECGGQVQSHFTIDAPIGRDPVSRVRRAVRSDGKPARTDVECVASVDGLHALRCRLHTGRTHQIRVHLASRGMPLVADSLYGGKPALGMTRQALHAVRLALAHPRSAAALDFTAAPPHDFLRAWGQVAPGYNCA
jgi:23S rRNA pseudouridine1911/1915/1917 synthase